MFVSPRAKSPVDSTRYAYISETFASLATSHCARSGTHPLALPGNRNLERRFFGLIVADLLFSVSVFLGDLLLKFLETSPQSSTPLFASSTRWRAERDEAYYDTRGANRDDRVSVMTWEQKRCHHGRQKHQCRECTPCPHGKQQNSCKECTSCVHGKLKHSCKECTSCVHGKLKHSYVIGTPSPHGKVKRSCGKCNPCPHGKLKQHYVKCSPCPHGKRKQDCAKCNPCPHGKLKGNCAACKPCPHGKLKYTCAACKTARAAPAPAPAPSVEIKEEPFNINGYYDMGD